MMKSNEARSKQFATVQISILLLASCLSATMAKGGVADDFFRIGWTPCIGSVSDDYWFIDMVIGIEQFENGKKSAHRLQQWTLSCTPEPFTREPRCFLDRFVIDQILESGPTVSQHRHSTEDGSLEIVRLNFESNELDFNVAYTDGSRSMIFVNMKKGGTALYLAGFHGTTTGKSTSGEPVLVDLRIPEYTYVRQIPVVMDGLKTEFERDWDQMAAGLPDADRGIVAKMVAARDGIYSKFVDEMMSDPDGKRISDRAQRTSSEAELNQFLDDRFVHRIREWLDSSAISAPSKEKVIKFLRDH